MGVVEKTVKFEFVQKISSYQGVKMVGKVICDGTCENRPDLFGNVMEIGWIGPNNEQHLDKVCRRCNVEWIKEQLKAEKKRARLIKAGVVLKVKMKREMDR